MRKQSGLRNPRNMGMLASAVAFFLVAGIWALFGPSPNAPATRPTAETAATAEATAPADVAEPFGPALVSSAELRELATSAPTPVFWAGELPDTELEATIAATGAVQVRYLPAGSQAGTTEQALTIVSWPAPEAWTMILDAAQEDGARSGGSGNLRYLARPSNATNAYLVNEGVATLAEVFSPAEDAAWTLVSTGGLELVQD